MIVRSHGPCPSSRGSHATSQGLMSKVGSKKGSYPQKGNGHHKMVKFSDAVGQSAQIHNLPKIKPVIKVPKRGYHKSVSAIAVSKLKKPMHTIHSNLGTEAAEKLSYMPELVSNAIAVEHILKDRHGREVMVQSTPSEMAFLSNCLTTLKGIDGKKLDLPYMQLRRSPPVIETEQVVEAMKKSGKDTDPQLQRILLSGTYGFLHNLKPEESAIYYLLNSRACTNHDVLKRIAVNEFKQGCKEAGMSEEAIEEKTTEFLRIFNQYADLRKPTLLFVSYNKKDADEIGYNSLPFGRPHKEAQISKVLGKVLRKEYFCKKEASDLQLRVVGSQHVLNPDRISVVDVTNPAHLDQLGVIEHREKNELPNSVKKLFKTHFSAAEMSEREAREEVRKRAREFLTKLA